MFITFFLFPCIIFTSHLKNIPMFLWNKWQDMNNIPPFLTTWLTPLSPFSSTHSDVPAFYSQIPFFPALFFPFPSFNPLTSQKSSCELLMVWEIYSWRFYFLRVLFHTRSICVLSPPHNSIFFIGWAISLSWRLRRINTLEKETDLGKMYRRINCNRIGSFFYWCFPWA